MITIQIPEAHHAGTLGRFIEEYGLTSAEPVHPEESMILVEDERILGYAAYRRSEDEGVVIVLYINPNMRSMGFGDGLLRATLNLMERSGIRRFFIPVDEGTKGFLISEGLIPSQEGPEWVKAPMADPLWFEGTLPEFFQKPCKGGRR